MKRLLNLQCELATLGTPHLLVQPGGEFQVQLEFRRGPQNTCNYFKVSDSELISPKKKFNPHL